MWYIFPQLDGLGISATSIYYAIKGRGEAIAYLNHEILGQRLIEITSELLLLNNLSAYDIFGRPDFFKLKSSMTLFSAISDENNVFSKVLQKYYNGNFNKNTVDLL